MKKRSSAGGEKVTLPRLKLKERQREISAKGSTVSEKCTKKTQVQETMRFICRNFTLSPILLE